LKNYYSLYILILEFLSYNDLRNLLLSCCYDLRSVSTLIYIYATILARSISIRVQELYSRHSVAMYVSFLLRCTCGEFAAALNLQSCSRRVWGVRNYQNSKCSRGCEREEMERNRELSGSPLFEKFPKSG